MTANRPRVVMVVMNQITGDSRVQKVARSAAEAGWDVVLLGRAAGDRLETSTLGGARVMRLPTPLEVTARRRRTIRRGVAGRIGFFNPDEERLDRAELRFRRADADARLRWLAEDAAAGPGGAARTRLTLSRLRVRADVTARRAIHMTRREAARRHADRLEKPWPAAAAVRGALLGRLVLGGGWRRTQPDLIDFELAFGPLLDELAPDLIHAHDINSIGLAARAAARARVAGRVVKVVYDAHEWVAGFGGYDPLMRAGYLGLEAEYARRVDAVVTVSPAIAELLRERYRLPEAPTVVTNSPYLAPPRPDAPNLRRVVGLGPDVPLLVYSGWLAPERGVGTLVAALPSLPDAHAVVVAGARNAHVRALEKSAAQLGVADRFHVAGYVDPQDVVDYLSSADVGVITNLPEPNNELAINTKYREYMHARLPIVVSDIRTMAAYTRQLGNGEVFPAGDAAGLARAAAAVLADRPRYVAAYQDQELLAEHSWQRQGAILDGLYRRVTGLNPQPLTDRQPDAGPGDARPGPSLLIGPSNMAGQAWAWAQAVRERLPEAAAQVLALERDSALRFPADQRISQRQWQSRDWHLAQRDRIVAEHTHVLFEGGLALTGAATGGLFADDAAAFAAAGLRVGLVFHGSDLRDPRRHRELHPDSPYADPNSELTLAAQRRWDELAPLLAAFAGPVFVSTPDLLDYLPTARWLPVVVDAARWQPGQPVLRARRPVVLHAPTRGPIKGSATVDAVAEALVAEGLIEYQRVEGVPVDELPALVRAADIVLDQFGVGSYGVLAAQAMAAGRVVVGHVDERVRARLLHELPIVQSRAADLRAVLTGLLADRDAAQAAAAAGPSFVARHHTGAPSAQALAEFLMT